MEARTVNDLLPAASHDDAVGCLVAIISWSQSGPVGTVLDLVGMQNSKALNMPKT
jgi:hypothetical protein